MRIALCQINPTVGDIAHNARRVIDFARDAKSQGAQIAVFPELCIPGYPPKDLLLKSQFIDDNIRAVEMIASHTQGIDCLVGYAARNPNSVGRMLFNAVAVLRGGKIAAQHYKSLLPTYDVFDESRYFEPGPAALRNQLVDLCEIPVGLSICEDLWNDEHIMERRLYQVNPIRELNLAGARLMINTSASPFVVGKQDFRLKLFAEQAREYGKPLIMVNQVGGNDELIFDGNSVAIDASGKLIAQLKDFEEDLVVVDVECDQKQCHLSGAAAVVAHSKGIESIYKALILGLRDYVRKCGFKSVVLGLSGGIDSALTAALAVDALGKDKVTGVAMPSRFSSDHSVNDAKLLAENLGIEFHIVPIKSIHDQFEQTLSPAFTGKERDVTEENIQARIRGVLLMAFSNKFNHLLLTTGNKSEVAVGYCTLYGDMCGGLAVISDVPKTTVYELSRFINKRAGRAVIPENSITKAPSAELRPNQTDQDSLPPYEVLDAILQKYVEEEQNAGDIISAGFAEATVMRVIRLIDRAEYKRRQAAPGLKVTSRAFGFGRRMPIAQNYVHRAPKHGEPSPVLE